MRETADKPSLEDILQHAWLGRLETIMKSQVRLRNCSGPEETRQAWRLGRHGDYAIQCPGWGSMGGGLRRKKALVDKLAQSESSLGFHFF